MRRRCARRPSRPWNDKCLTTGQDVATAMVPRDILGTLYRSAGPAFLFFARLAGRTQPEFGFTTGIPGGAPVNSWYRCADLAPCAERGSRPDLLVRLCCCEGWHHGHLDAVLDDQTFLDACRMVKEKIGQLTSMDRPTRH